MSIFERLFRRSKKVDAEKVARLALHGVSTDTSTADAPEDHYPPEVLRALLSDFFSGKTLSQKQQEVVERHIELTCEQHDDLLEQYLSGEPFTTSQKQKIISETGDTQSRQPVPPAGEDYAAKCVVESYKEQDELRSWDSDPAFRRVLDPLNAGQNAKAADEARALSQKFPDFADIYVWWAKALLNDHKHDEARNLLREALSKCKQKYPLLNLMGEVEWKSGCISEAVYWWVQGLICQQTRKRFGEEVGAYLYLYHVADALGLSALATQLRDRVDGIRPGQIRLSPDAAGSLTRLLRASDTTPIKTVLQMVETKYFGSEPPVGRSKSSEEINDLLKIAQNGDLSDQDRVKALKRLAEVGDSTTIGPLMRLRDIESRGLGMIKFFIDDTLESIRARLG